MGLSLLLSNFSDLFRSGSVQKEAASSGRVHDVDVAAVLAAWRIVHKNGDINVDVTRYIPGSVPSWADWAGSAWVSGRERGLRRLEEQQLQLPDECWLHLSLPPGWEPQHENEHRAAQQYGRWLSETEWEPPPGRSPNSWQEIY